MPNLDAGADALASPSTSESSQASTVGRLFEEQARRVRKFLRWRLKSEQDAEDASQEVFLRLWRREQEGALEKDARSYMLAAVFNVAIDVERRRSVRGDGAHVSVDDVELASVDADAADALFWRRAVDEFVDAMNELPDLTREVFALSHVEGLTHTAIAERLDISVRNCERHLAKAIAHCQERLKDYLK